MVSTTNSQTCAILQNRVIPEMNRLNTGGTVDYIQTELKETRFISVFMAAVCSSLERDDICSIAARELYKLSPYYRIVFTFRSGCEEKNITISPMVQKGILTAKTSRNSGTPPRTISGLPETTPASVHLELLENLGSITIYHKPGQEDVYSATLLENVAICFSQAIRNMLEHSRIKDLAMRDGLTDIFNRRIFDETLAQKVKSPDAHPVSLLIIDLDNFKQVNDSYGHQAGDQVLKTFANILKESCRGQDMVARFGGEEFAIILSQTKTATAHAIAQRIRNRLAKTVFTFDEKQHRMTVSIGLATCQEVKNIFTSNLVKLADRALYQAKKTGKNKVCVFPVDLLSDMTYSTDCNSFCPLVPANC